MTDALVLNASFEPLCVVSERRATVLMLTGKAEVLEVGEAVLRSATLIVPAPAVVRLCRFVRVPFRASVPLTRRGVLARDGGHCVYCGSHATSLDHVLPRSRGGTHTWDNVVAACSRCNHHKADRTPSEMGWRIKVTPVAPQGTGWRVLGSRRPDPRWRAYLDLGPELDLAEQATA